MSNQSLSGASNEFPPITMAEVSLFIPPDTPSLAELGKDSRFLHQFSVPSDPPSEQLDNLLDRGENANCQGTHRSRARLEPMLASSFGPSLSEEPLLLGVGPDRASSIGGNRHMAGEQPGRLLGDFREHRNPLDSGLELHPSVFGGGKIPFPSQLSAHSEHLGTPSSPHIVPSFPKFLGNELGNLG